MKKYWIIENGKPIGPFTASELKVRRDFTPGLPVWYSGLPDWTTVGELPELSILLPEEEISQPHEQQIKEKESSVEEQNLGFNSNWIRPQQEPVQPKVSFVVEKTKQPPTYVGWNIFMTLCCCLPVGLIGLVYGSTVNRRWLSGDIEGAQKASDIAAWCLILSIVLSLVSWPFQMIYSFI